MNKTIILRFLLAIILLLHLPINQSVKEAFGLKINFVTGVFNLNPGLKVDSDGNVSSLKRRGNLKFPTISNGFLSLLQTHKNSSSLLAYRIEDILQTAGPKRIEPAFTHREASSDEDSMQILHPKIKKVWAFFPGPAFLIENTNKWEVISIPDGKLYQSSEEMINFYDASSKAKYYLTSTKLFKNGRQIYYHKDGLLYSFHRWEKSIALGYHDSDNDPYVCLMERKKCRNLPGGSGQFTPQFSGSGRFLATARVERDVWNINIYELKRGDPKFKKEIRNISFYDISGNQYFLYFGSFGWIGDRLIYRKTGNDNNLKIFAVDCNENGCGKESVLEVEEMIYMEPPEENAVTKGPYYWTPSAGEKMEMSDSIAMRIESLVWVQPFQFKDKSYIAAQAIIRNSSKYLKQYYQGFERILLYELVD